MWHNFRVPLFRGGWDGSSNLYSTSAGIIRSLLKLKIITIIIIMIIIIMIIIIIITSKFVELISPAYPSMTFFVNKGAILMYVR